MAGRAARAIVAGAAAVVMTASAVGCAGTTGGSIAADRPAGSLRRVSATASTTTEPPAPPANTLSMKKFTRISGGITPKSVVASGTGLVTAQNMMYSHTVTAYDGDGKLVATVPDSVKLSDFGIAKPGTYKGAPVEAAFTSDAKKEYVSNYSMYGPGFREGSDQCTPASKVPASFLYRIDTTTWKVDQVVPVGATPKYVAVSPDDTRVLATNWCTWDLTIADVATGKVQRTVQLGRYPRGIAVTKDSATAYVAVMGTSDIAKVHLADGTVSWIKGVGRGPRHLVLSPDGASLYATLNAEGAVAKIDTATDTVVKKVSTGKQPRSMAISRDGTAVYVVNYESNNVSKLDAADLHEIQKVPSGQHPIGIAYDDSTGRVWVANYSGTIDVYDEAAAA